MNVFGRMLLTLQREVRADAHPNSRQRLYREDFTQADG